MSSHYILTVLFTSDSPPTRTRVEWNFPRCSTFYHSLPQVNYQPSQISPSLLTSCVKKLHLPLDHIMRQCTSCLLSFATTVNTLPVTTFVTDGNLDRPALEMYASPCLNFVALWVADVNDARSLDLSPSTTIDRVVAGYELVMIRLRKSALRRWSLSVPLPSCSSTK